MVALAAVLERSILTSVCAQTIEWVSNMTKKIRNLVFIYNDTIGLKGYMSINRPIDLIPKMASDRPEAPVKVFLTLVWAQFYLRLTAVALPAYSTV